MADLSPLRIRAIGVIGACSLAATLVGPTAAFATTATLPETPAQCPVPMTSVVAEPATGGAGTSPAGSTFAESPKAGIRFAIPAEFTALNPSALSGVSGDELPAAIVAMASVQGLDPGAFLAQLAAQTDLLVVGPPVDGFAPNLNVITNPAPVLPDAAAITTQLEAVGATNVTVTPVATSLGDGIVTSYEVDTGTKTIFGGQLGTVTPTGTAMISATANDRATTDEIVQTIIATVTALDASAANPGASGADGCVTVSSARAGLSFVVPAGYTAEDPAALALLDESQLPPELTELAATQGMTAKELLSRTAQQSDLLVLGPVANGVTPNLNVITTVGAMPTAEQLTAELQKANIQPTITTESSPVGDVMFATYQLSLNGNPAEARQILVATRRTSP